MIIRFMKDMFYIVGGGFFAFYMWFLIFFWGMNRLDELVDYLMSR